MTIKELYDIAVLYNIEDFDAKDILNVKEQQYQRGIKDAWNAFCKLILSVSNGGLSNKQIRYIFPGRDTISSVLLNVPPEEITRRICDYIKNSKESEE